MSLLTDEQRLELLGMLHRVFQEIRYLAWHGAAKQAGDLADAFHHLPDGMVNPNFDLIEFREAFLVPYEQQYPQRVCSANYVELINRVIGNLSK